MMTEYLNLADLLKEGYQVIKTIRQMSDYYQIEQGYEKALRVNYEIAHASVAPNEYTAWIQPGKELSTLNPLFKKYYELIALSVYSSCLKSDKTKNRITIRINVLIEQTGFTYFSSYQVR